MRFNEIEREIDGIDEEMDRNGLKWVNDVIHTSE